MRIVSFLAHSLHTDIDQTFYHDYKKCFLRTKRRFNENQICDTIELCLYYGLHKLCYKCNRSFVNVLFLTL